MNRNAFLIVTALVVLGIGLPFAVEGFRLFQITQMLIYAIAVLGLNLLTGYNGQLSLGHGAFYAIGAYAVAIVMSHAGLPWWLALPIAAVASFVVGFLFGFPALRLEGHYLALATFGLALTVPALLKNNALSSWTGGVQGLFLEQPAPPEIFADHPDWWWYYVTFVIMLAMFLVARNLVDSRVGRALTAIRDNRPAAEAMGVRAAVFKSTAFGLSALYTGVAGGLSALVVQFVSPDSFPLFLSINLLVGSVVGGVASIPGALLGGVFIVLVPNLASDVSQAATGAIFGVFLIVFIYVLPGGIWGIVRRFTARGLTEKIRLQGLSGHRLKPGDDF